MCENKLKLEIEKHSIISTYFICCISLDFFIKSNLKDKIVTCHYDQVTETCHKDQCGSISVQCGTIMEYLCPKKITNSFNRIPDDVEPIRPPTSGWSKPLKVNEIVMPDPDRRLRHAQHFVDGLGHDFNRFKEELLLQHFKANLKQTMRC